MKRRALVAALCLAFFAAAASASEGWKPFSPNYPFPDPFPDPRPDPFPIPNQLRIDLNDLKERWRNDALGVPMNNWKKDAEIDVSSWLEKKGAEIDVSSWLGKKDAEIDALRLEIVRLRDRIDVIERDPGVKVVKGPGT